MENDDTRNGYLLRTKIVDGYIYIFRRMFLGIPVYSKVWYAKYQGEERSRNESDNIQDPEQTNR